MPTEPNQNNIRPITILDLRRALERLPPGCMRENVYLRINGELHTVVAGIGGIFQCVAANGHTGPNREIAWSEIRGYTAKYTAPVDSPDGRAGIIAGVKSITHV